MLLGALHGALAAHIGYLALVRGALCVRSHGTYSGPTCTTCGPPDGLRRTSIYTLPGYIVITLYLRCSYIVLTL